VNQCNTKTQIKKDTNFDLQKGLIQREETAKKIAESIWIPMYGESILEERPYSAKLIGDSIWIVEGTLHEETLGGVARIEIRKLDCKVLKIAHGR
jgi:hypothetical protein